MSEFDRRFDDVITALITPFYKGAVDEGSFIRLLHQQTENGVHGFVINGTTGESPTLTWDEVRRLFEIAKAEIGTKATLILGTGTNSTQSTIEKTQLAEKLGADAALLVVPYYNRPPQRGMIAHFREVAGQTRLPLLLYNVPSRTGSAIEPGAVAAVAESPNIVGIKEASGDMEHLRQLQTILHKPFWLLSGDDASGIEFCRRGGHGIISVVSHVIPKELSALVKAARGGDAAVTSKYQGYQELLRWLYVEANPIPVKWALQEMGIIRSAEMRLPLSSLESSHFEGFQKCLRQLGKI